MVFGEGGQQGFIERAAASLYRTLKNQSVRVLGVLAALAWGGLKIWTFSRLMLRRSYSGSAARPAGP